MNYQAVLNYISEFIQPEFGKGKVADYIPSLANIPPTKFGMAIHMVDGQTYKVGDAEENFSIQSISKLFVLQLVMRHMGDMVWTKVGKEPSGDPFNSLVLLEHENGIPRNPFINAGALATTDMLMSTTQDASLLIRNYLKFISMNPAIESDPLVAQSELETSHVNHALAHLMKSYGVIENDVEALIEVYCQHCAISMNCVDLAAAILPLADKGYSAVCGETILPERNVKRLNAVMLTCGTYDSVGSFAYRVGLPAKSGVGGGIVAVVPGKMSIAVWSPELDKFGNSYVGTAALEQFTSLTHCSIF
tara:strand:- start:46 stop:960 length:915 start_codon:yes stop_codon:yes gene_type:complete